MLLLVENVSLNMLIWKTLLRQAVRCGIRLG